MRLRQSMHFTLDHKRRSQAESERKMETLSAYASDFRFPLGRKRSYDYNDDSTTTLSLVETSLTCSASLACSASRSSLEIGSTFQCSSCEKKKKHRLYIQACLHHKSLRTFTCVNVHPYELPYSNLYCRLSWQRKPRSKFINLIIIKLNVCKEVNSMALNNQTLALL